MRVKADREKEEAAATKRAVSEIEKAAAAQYERDRAAAEAARKALGSWVREHRVVEGRESDVEKSEVCVFLACAKMS